MDCNICELKGKLYLYTKGDLIYSLCARCLRTQEQIDEIKHYKNYEKMLQKIANGEITRADVDGYFNNNNNL